MRSNEQDYSQLRDVRSEFRIIPHFSFHFVWMLSTTGMSECLKSIRGVKEWMDDAVWKDSLITIVVEERGRENYQLEATFRELVGEDCILRLLHFPRSVLDDILHRIGMDSFEERMILRSHLIATGREESLFLFRQSFSLNGDVTTKLGPNKVGARFQCGGDRAQRLYGELKDILPLPQRFPMLCTPLLDMITFQGDASHVEMWALSLLETAIITWEFSTDRSIVDFESAFLLASHFSMTNIDWISPSTGAEGESAEVATSMRYAENRQVQQFMTDLTVDVVLMVSNMTEIDPAFETLYSIYDSIAAEHRCKARIYFVIRSEFLPLVERFMADNPDVRHAILSTTVFDGDEEGIPDVQSAVKALPSLSTFLLVQPGILLWNDVVNFMQRFRNTISKTCTTGDLSVSIVVQENQEYTSCVLEEHGWQHVHESGFLPCAGRGMLSSKQQCLGTIPWQSTIPHAIFALKSAFADWFAESYVPTGDGPFSREQMVWASSEPEKCIIGRRKNFANIATVADLPYLDGALALWKSLLQSFQPGQYNGICFFVVVPATSYDIVRAFIEDELNSQPIYAQRDFWEVTVVGAQVPTGHSPIMGHHFKYHRLGSSSNGLRFLIPHLLSNLDIVLYLDSDILVQGDIVEKLYAPALPSDRRVRAFQEPVKVTQFVNVNHPLLDGRIDPAANSFGSSVLVLDVDYWLKENITQLILLWMEMMWYDPTIRACCFNQPPSILTLSQHVSLFNTTVWNHYGGRGSATHPFSYRQKFLTSWNNHAIDSIEWHGALKPWKAGGNFVPTWMKFAASRSTASWLMSEGMLRFGLNVSEMSSGEKVHSGYPCRLNFRSSVDVPRKYTIVWVVYQGQSSSVVSSVRTTVDTLHSTESLEIVDIVLVVEEKEHDVLTRLLPVGLCGAIQNPDKLRLRIEITQHNSWQRHVFDNVGVTSLHHQVIASLSKYIARNDNDYVIVLAGNVSLLGNITLMDSFHSNKAIFSYLNCESSLSARVASHHNVSSLKRQINPSTARFCTPLFDVVALKYKHWRRLIAGDTPTIPPGMEGQILSWLNQLSTLGLSASDLFTAAFMQATMNNYGNLAFHGIEIAGCDGIASSGKKAVFSVCNNSEPSREDPSGLSKLVSSARLKLRVFVPVTDLQQVDEALLTVLRVQAHSGHATTGTDLEFIMLFESQRIKDWVTQYLCQSLSFPLSINMRLLLISQQHFVLPSPYAFELSLLFRAVHQCNLEWSASDSALWIYPGVILSRSPETAWHQIQMKMLLYRQTAFVSPQLDIMLFTGLHSMIGQVHVDINDNWVFLPLEEIGWKHVFSVNGDDVTVSGSLLSSYSLAFQLKQSRAPHPNSWRRLLFGTEFSHFVVERLHKRDGWSLPMPTEGQSASLAPDQQYGQFMCINYPSKLAEDKRVNIALTVDWKYFDGALATIQSALAHLTPIEKKSLIFHLFVPKEEDCAIFLWFYIDNAFETQATICCKAIPMSDGQQVRIGTHPRLESMANDARFVLPFHLEAEKILYVDGDVIFQSNLMEIYDMDVSNVNQFVFAADTPVKLKELLNPSHSLLLDMNLDSIPAHGSSLFLFNRTSWINAEISNEVYTWLDKMRKNPSMVISKGLHNWPALVLAWKAYVRGFGQSWSHTGGLGHAKPGAAPSSVAGNNSIEWHGHFKPWRLRGGASNEIWHAFAGTQYFRDWYLNNNLDKALTP